MIMLIRLASKVSRCLSALSLRVNTIGGEESVADLGSQDSADAPEQFAKVLLSNSNARVSNVDTAQHLRLSILRGIC